MPTMTDTILTIRCPHCMAGIEFRTLTAYKDGRFVCRDCAHTVRPGVPKNKCTCRACLRLSLESLSTAHGSHLLTYYFAPRLRPAECPPDDPFACEDPSAVSKAILWVSAGIYVVGVFVAYVLGPILIKLDHS